MLLTKIITWPILLLSLLLLLYEKILLNLTKSPKYSSVHNLRSSMELLNNKRRRLFLFIFGMRRWASCRKALYEIRIRNDAPWTPMCNLAATHVEQQLTQLASLLQALLQRARNTFYESVVEIIEGQKSITLIAVRFCQLPVRLRLHFRKRKPIDSIGHERAERAKVLQTFLRLDMLKCIISIGGDYAARYCVPWLELMSQKLMVVNGTQLTQNEIAMHNDPKFLFLQGETSNCGCCAPLTLRIIIPSKESICRRSSNGERPCPIRVALLHSESVFGC